MSTLDKETLWNRNPQYYADLKSIHTEALWAVPPKVPTGPYQPNVWRFKEVMPALEKSKSVYTMGESHEDRRALNYVNPNGGKSMPTISAGIQMIFPGESATCHRHSSTAGRFMISGRGGFTVQEGQKYRMEPGDLILTPNWTWHDHGNDGDEPSVWLDCTDIAFQTWGGLFQEDLPEVQKVTHDRPTANIRYTSSGMLPVGDRPASVNSPQMLYKWKAAEDAVRSLLKLGEDPYDCAIVEYVNPLTAGHCTSTQAHYLQMLRKGFHGKARRRTEHAHCYIFRGRGSTIVDGEEYKWEQGDTIVIPSWSFYEHIADEETFLLYFSDLPLREPFGIHRMEAYSENGGRQAGKPLAA